MSLELWRFLSPKMAFVNGWKSSCVVETLMVYMLLLQTTAEARSQSASKHLTKQISKQPCAQSCNQYLVILNYPGYKQCVLQCCVLTKTLDDNPLTKLLSQIYKRHHCPDNVQVHYERQTEKVNILIPQKRRWGNTIAPCINAYCNRFVGASRLECIMDRCNASRY